MKRKIESNRRKSTWINRNKLFLFYIFYRSICGRKHVAWTDWLCRTNFKWEYRFSGRSERKKSYHHVPYVPKTQTFTDLLLFLYWLKTDNDSHRWLLITSDISLDANLKQFWFKSHWKQQNLFYVFCLINFQLDTKIDDEVNERWQKRFFLSLCDNYNWRDAIDFAEFLISLQVAQSVQEQKQVCECLCFRHVWNMMITFLSFTSSREPILSLKIRPA
jgi:hypothetical protein